MERAAFWNWREIGERCGNLSDDEIPATFEPARWVKDEDAVTPRDTFDAESAGVGYANLDARLWLIDGAVIVAIPVNVTVDDRPSACRQCYRRLPEPATPPRPPK